MNQLGGVRGCVRIGGNYDMAKKKEQWKPRVNCFLKDMTPISPENISVPENHLVYRILTKINQERLQHD